MDTDSRRETRPPSFFLRLARGIALAALLGGFLLALSESALYLLGRGAYRPPRALSDGAVKAADIWCLGDSHTQGAGAPVGTGYPEQLDGLLRRERRAGNRVLNLGVGGSNSSQEVEFLKSALERGGRPRVVVFMGGSNDIWNLARADRRALLDAYGPGGLIYSRLQRLRTFKLVFNYLLPSLRRRLAPRLADSLRAADPDEIAQLLSTNHAPEAVELLTSQGLLSPQQRLLLGGAYFSEGRYDRARDLFAGLETAFRPREVPVDVRVLRAEAGRLAEGGRGGEAVLATFKRFRPNPNNDRESSAYWLGRGWAELDLKRYGAARDCFARAARAETDSPSDMATEAEGWSYLLEGDDARALSVFRRFDRMDPTARFAPPFWAYAGAAWISAKRGDRASALAALDRAKMAYPEQVWPRHPLEGAWICMLEADLARLEGDSGREGRMAARSRELAPLLTLGAAGEPGFRLQDAPSQSIIHSAPIIFFLAHATRDPALAILRRNLDELAALGRRDGFRLVLMGYPKSELRPVNAALEEFARSRNLAYVDLLRAMGDIDANESLRSADGTHPNAKGYALIAGRLLNDISRNPRASSPSSPAPSAASLRSARPYR